jgi:heterodisulfide reductase subunit B
VSMKIFDWLNQITYDKQPWNSFTEEDKKSFEPYMIHRFLSMNPEYIEFVNLVQTFPYTNKEKIYNIYLYMIPRKKMFLKYIKSSTKKRQEKLLGYIASYYECSLGEANEYIDILRENGVKDILNKMGVDEKEQKKLLKNG